MTSLRAVRINKCITQKELSEESGINLRVLQHYEQGTRNFNSAALNVILSAAIALDCKVIDIIDDPELLDLIQKAKIK